MKVQTQLLGVIALFWSANVLAEHIIHVGQLFDARSARVLDTHTIRIEGDRITAVEPGFLEPQEGDHFIDLSDYFVMPGLIDMHVHISSQTSPTRFVERFTKDPAEVALNAVPYARRTIHAGFTTVRDLGSADGVAMSLRDAINAGVLTGPRIYAAGKSLATTGGHADPTNGVNARLRGDPGPTAGVVNSAQDARKAVRARYKEGADVIKLTATGGVLSEAKNGQNPQFTEDEIEAIVATAKDYGFKVAAHAHGADGMARAVRAGVDSIEHGSLMTEEVMRLMKRNGTWYVPTILAGMFVAEKAQVDGFFSPLVRPKAAAIGPKIKETFAEAYAAGVKIAFGTDTGVSAHGDNWQEFVHMVDAGMPAREALQSATLNAAELLGESENLGVLEAGKWADVVAFPRNPILDIQVMGEVAWVMKAGEIVLDERFEALDE